LRFRLYPLRFNFRARDAIRFPEGKSANILRGGFGLALRRVSDDAYTRIFEPRAGADGPSGLRDWPRPFVFRAAHLDRQIVAAGGEFHFGVNFFDVRNPGLMTQLGLAFDELAREGLGPGRGRAELASFVPPDEPLTLSLDPVPEQVSRLRVRFVTPTELKGADGPEFFTLAARIRDRLSTLRELYDDDGPLPIDFRDFGEKARRVRMTRCEIKEVSRTRRSSRTGQEHPIGGFIGEAEYEGDLAMFLPYLKAAAWTGVGRQTVWGNGEMKVKQLV
jgi:CRISPR-associated endoribonuclease Cas6